MPPQAGERRGAWLPLLLGLLLAAAVTVRLSALHALPAAVAALVVATPGWRRRPCSASAPASGPGWRPLLLAQWVTFGGPLRTGYHLWTPEWAGGAGGKGRSSPWGTPSEGRPSPPGPGSPTCSTTARLAGPAGGRGRRRGVGGPVHATAAGVLAVGAVLGILRAAAPAVRGRTLAVFASGGCWGRCCARGPTSRTCATWGPGFRCGSCSAPAGWLWPVCAGSPGRGVVLLLALAPLPKAAGGGPGLGGRGPGAGRPPPPRLAQLRSLARDSRRRPGSSPPWMAPSWSTTSCGAQRRRFVPSRGAWSSWTSPLQHAPRAPEVRSELLAQAGQRPGRWSSIGGRWSSPRGYRTSGGVAVDPGGAGLAPGGRGGPRSPSYYVVLPGAERVAWGQTGSPWEEGRPCGTAAGGVFVYAGGSAGVPDVARLRALGLRWEDVRRIPDLVLEALPEGPAGPRRGLTRERPLILAGRPPVRCLSKRFDGRHDQGHRRPRGVSISTVHYALSGTRTYPGGDPGAGAGDPSASWTTSPTSAATLPTGRTGRLAVVIAGLEPAFANTYFSDYVRARSRGGRDYTVVLYTAYRRRADGGWRPAHVLRRREADGIVLLGTQVPGATWTSWPRGRPLRPAQPGASWPPSISADRRQGAAGRRPTSWPWATTP